MEEYTEPRMDERNIGKLARFMGVSPHTIKYYEKIGLLASDRDKHSNYRRYELRMCTYLSECLKYRGMGFPLKELETLIHTAGDTEHREMMIARLEAVEAELKRLQDLYQFLLEYQQECRHFDENLGEWYIMPWNKITYCRLQTSCLNFTEHNLGDDPVNIMEYAPRTAGVVVLRQNYLNGGIQDFSWGQSVTFDQPMPEFEAQPEFLRLAPKKAFVTYRMYTGPYVASGTMAEDIRCLFHQYSSEFPSDLYAFRMKVVHDQDGKDWNYFKIVIPI